MQKSHQTKAIKYIRDQIEGLEAAMARARADLDVLLKDPPDVPKWNGMVISAWQNDGEPNWNGMVEASTLPDAVYEVMLAFCKKAGRVYPGYKSHGRDHIYDSFDVQGDIALSMQLPNGTNVPVDRARLAQLKRKFNNKAPMPKPKPRKEPVGLT